MASSPYLIKAINPDFPNSAKSHTQKRFDLNELLIHQPDVPDRSALMIVLDDLNQRYGRSTISAASSFAPVDAVWKMKQERMTPAYTTDWDQIIDVWR